MLPLESLVPPPAPDPLGSDVWPLSTQCPCVPTSASMSAGLQRWELTVCFQRASPCALTLCRPPSLSRQFPTALGAGGGALLPPFTELPFLLFLKFEERFPVLRKCLSGLLTS